MAGTVKAAKASKKAQPGRQTASKEFDDFEGFVSTDEEFEGFNSTSESEDSEDEIDVVKNEEGIAHAKADIAKLAQQSKESKSSEEKSEPGPRKCAVVYVGRIPHGFYEEQMREYFGQFGTINRLRLSRNKRTGASKHYAFVEFASPQVAEVVCETMDNYLLFGHILKVKPMDPERVHESMWVGANRKFQAIPWSKVMKQRFDRKKSREWWEAHAAKEIERRQAKNEQLQALGIEYSY